MNAQEAEGVVALALMAALADGRTGGEERDQLKSLLESLGSEHDLPAIASIHQRVILKKLTLADAVAMVTSPDSQRMAFEIAVCVADADGRVTSAEQAFLDSLERAFGLDHEEAVAFEAEADTIAIAPVETKRDEDVVDLLGDAGSQAAGAPGVEPAVAPLEQGPVDPVAKEVDSLVLKYSILNGALELLPQNLATMAILPLQTKMVYGVGKKYGHRLSAAHIKEFVAVLGVGATSQMVENFARKALGKFVKKTLGKTAGKIAKTATGPMITFATTYAMGRVAAAYYSGGRTLSAVDLRWMFQRDLARGKGLYESYRPQVEANAQNLSPSKVLDLVRGGGV